MRTRRLTAVAASSRQDGVQERGDDRARPGLIYQAAAAGPGDTIEKLMFILLLHTNSVMSCCVVSIARPTTQFSDRADGSLHTAQKRVLPRYQYNAQLNRNLPQPCSLPWLCICYVRRTASECSVSIARRKRLPLHCSVLGAWMPCREEED